MYSTYSKQPTQSEIETLYQEALARFPYELTPTYITQGDLIPEDDCQEIDYSEEFTFTIGKLLNEDLEAGGWLDLRYSLEGGVSISGLFGVARNGDWEEGSIFPECMGIHVAYNLKTKIWELWIDTF